MDLPTITTARNWEEREIEIDGKTVRATVNKVSGVSIVSRTSEHSRFCQEYRSADGQRVAVVLQSRNKSAYNFALTRTHAKHGSLKPRMYSPVEGEKDGQGAKGRALDEALVFVARKHFEEAGLYKAAARAQENKGDF